MLNKNSENVNAESVNEKESFLKIKSIILAFLVLFIFIIYSFTYQSTKQVYLTYEIINLNKQIDALNIKLREANVENEKIKTNQNIEKVATEQLGMVYPDKDKVVLVKENANNQQNNTEISDNIKLKIFVQSLYKETSNQLKNTNIVMSMKKSLKDLFPKFTKKTSTNNQKAVKK